jgi:hypothetical protein
VKVAREIAETLRREIESGRFLLTAPVEQFTKTSGLNNLEIRH